MVVIGSSFISMELVAAVSKRKLASIDVIGMEEYPFQAVLGEKVGAGLMKVCSTIEVNSPFPNFCFKYHESQGVKFHMEAKVDKIVASESDDKQATAVKVTSKDGSEKTLEADFVVMGVGVAPATEFLKQSNGFPQDVFQKDGGIAVDEFLKVKGLEDVYAIGDIAFYPQAFTGESRRVEHWNVGGFLS